MPIIFDAYMEREPEKVSKRRLRCKITLRAPFCTELFFDGITGKSGLEKFTKTDRLPGRRFSKTLKMSKAVIFFTKTLGCPNRLRYNIPET